MEKNKRIRPKIDKNNTITIKKLKESWNREELEDLLMKAINHGISLRNGLLSGITDELKGRWISNNL